MSKKKLIQIHIKYIFLGKLKLPFFNEEDLIDRRSIASIIDIVLVGVEECMG